MNSTESNAKTKLFTWLQILAISITVLILLLTAGFLWLQTTWVKPQFRQSGDAFFYGTIGTEIMPQTVFEVLPDLFPEKFQPRGIEAGDWIDQFGFIRSAANSQAAFPVGFILSNYRPKSGAPSPVPFVGLSCALCHTSQLQASNGEGAFVVGNGNISLNLFAWLNQIQASLLDSERLTVDSIAQSYEAKHGQPLTFQESLMTRLWLMQGRNRLQSTLPKYGEPYGGQAALSPDNVPTGPIRTPPFQTLVRNLFDRPGSKMAAYSKLSSIYHQDWQEWAQFDGSIRDLLARSSMAAFAAGATVVNMKNPEIANNIIQASEYTRTLDGASFADVFPKAAASLEPEKIKRGEKIYDDSCLECHGKPEVKTGNWIPGSRQGEVISLAEIGTDPKRVTYRYYEELPDRLQALFPEDHPFHFARSDARPGVAGSTPGYINKPLDAVFTRAPYLHNGSVLTLAELINLEPRQAKFYRGQNLYDTKNVGLLSPETSQPNIDFLFDTHRLGNSNQGHDYPWSYQGEGWNKQSLEDLLEYLKTL